MKPVLARAALAEWLQMLDSLEESIAMALTRLPIDEVGEDECDSGPANVVAGRQSGLDEIDDRFRGLQSRLDAAGRIAQDVESLLAEDERHSREWLDLAEQSRRRLAELPVHCLS